MWSVRWVRYQRSRGTCSRLVGTYLPNALNRNKLIGYRHENLKSIHITFCENGLLNMYFVD